MTGDWRFEVASTTLWNNKKIWIRRKFYSFKKYIENILFYQGLSRLFLGSIRILNFIVLITETAQHRFSHVNIISVIYVCNFDLV